MRREVSCRYKEMSEAQIGLQTGVGIANAITGALIKLPTLVELLIDKRKHGFTEWAKEGYLFGYETVPRECLEQILKECEKENIPVQIADPNNLCDSQDVTLIYRAAKGYEHDANGIITLDENGNKNFRDIADYGKVSAIIENVLKEYNRVHPLNTNDVNKDWIGEEIIDIPGLTLRQAELYQKTGLDYGVSSFIHYDIQTKTYGVSFSKAEMDRYEFDVSSDGERWLTACTMLQSYPEIDAYIQEQTKNDFIISECVKKAITGEKYEPQTIFALSSHEQIAINMRSNITFKENIATYTYYEQDVDGNLTNRMNQKMFDLSNEAEYLAFQKELETIGPHGVIDTAEYNEAIKTLGQFEDINPKYYTAYDQYINSIGTLKEEVAEITKNSEFCIQYKQDPNSNEKQWKAVEKRIPNSDKVIEFMLGTKGPGSPDIDDYMDQINNNLKLAQSGLKVTPSSQFVSIPSHMLKETADIVRETDAQIDRENTGASTAAERQVGTMNGELINSEKDVDLGEFENSVEVLSSDVDEQEWNLDE